MARFKIGEKVVLNNHEYSKVSFGEVGIVCDEDNLPEVLFEKGMKLCIDEDDLELYTDPASKIAQIVEQSITKSAEKIPVDRFEFCYIDEYGRDLTHRFEQQEGYYDLSDVIASFRLFLLGVGYEREEVNGIIREDRL